MWVRPTTQQIIASPPYIATQEKDILGGALEDQEDREMEICGGLHQLIRLVEETPMTANRRSYLLVCLEHIRAQIARQTDELKANILWRDN